MKFRFDIKLNDNDYLDFNRFTLIRSPYGKKQMVSFRIILTIMFVAVALFQLITYGFSWNSLFDSIPILIIFVVSQAFLKKLLALSLKGDIKRLKKSGKMPYSPESVIEFYEECFVEITLENKNEQKYSSIERISIVDGKMIYIHINNMMAYILPLYCFASSEQYNDFIDFIKSKCENFKVY